jgi:hypothetical protein
VNLCGNFTVMELPGANSFLKSFSQARLKYSATTSLFNKSRRISIDTHAVFRKLFAI